MIHARTVGARLKFADELHEARHGFRENPFSFCRTRQTGLPHHAVRRVRARPLDDRHGTAAERIHPLKPRRALLVVPRDIVFDFIFLDLTLIEVHVHRGLDFARVRRAAWKNGFAKSGDEFWISAE